MKPEIKIVEENGQLIFVIRPKPRPTATEIADKLVKLHSRKHQAETVQTQHQPHKTIYGFKVAEPVRLKKLDDGRTHRTEHE